jgi:hypothetical protein
MPALRKSVGTDGNRQQARGNRQQSEKLVQNVQIVQALRSVQSVQSVAALRFVPVGQCISYGKFHPPVSAIKIILQGAFKQAGDLVDVVAERTTAPGGRYV